jgi:hypothetical protein
MCATVSILVDRSPQKLMWKLPEQLGVPWPTIQTLEYDAVLCNIHK